MALFKRDQTPSPDDSNLAPIQALLAPAVAQPGDRDRVANLLGVLDDAIAQRSTDRTYEFGIALNRAGGFPDISRMTKYEEGSVYYAIAEEGGSALQRPWLWLAAVAREALAAGDALFVSRIAAAAWIWSVEFGPRMNKGAFFEGVVATPDHGSLAQVLSAGTRAIAIADGNERVRGTARLFAGVVVKELHDLVEPDVLATAVEISS